MSIQKLIVAAALVVTLGLGGSAVPSFQVATAQAQTATPSPTASVDNLTANNVVPLPISTNAKIVPIPLAKGEAKIVLMGNGSVVKP